MSKQLEIRLHGVVHSLVLKVLKFIWVAQAYGMHCIIIAFNENIIVILLMPLTRAQGSFIVCRRVCSGRIELQ